MSDKRYYVRARGKVLGPFSAGQLRSLQNRGQLSRLDEVSEDRQNWMSAAEVQGLFPATQSATVEPAPAAAPSDGQRSTPTAEEWYFVNADKEQQGPVSRSRLQELHAAGIVQNDTPVWKPGMDEWLPLADALNEAPQGRPRPERRRAEAGTGTQAVVAFLRDPVGGLPGLCNALGPGYACGVGLLFCLIYNLCALLGFVLVLASLLDVRDLFPRDVPFARPAGELPREGVPRGGPRIPVAEQAVVLLKLVGLALLPMVSLAASICIVRVITRGSGNFGFDVLSAGAVLLPLGLFLPLAGLLGPANGEVVVFLSFFVLCLSLLILNSAFTRVVHLSDQGVILAIPVTLVLTIWLCKVAVTSILFR